MKLLIHDLKNENIKCLNIDNLKTIVFSAVDNKFTYCMGCFKCWLKNPGRCIIKDSLENIGETIGRCDELIIISQVFYGSYSPKIKNILDRSISTSLPFFTFRNKRVYHIPRYKNKYNLKVFLYGEMTELEKQVSHDMVNLNGNNWGCKSTKLFIFEKKEEVIRCYNECVNY